MAYTFKQNMDVPIPVSVSGSVTLNSGATIISTISGQGVFLPSAQMVNISGQFVQIQSGQTIQLPVTQIVKTSGETVVIASGQTPLMLAPTGGKARGLLAVTGASGGVILTSGAVVSMTTKALAGNAGDIFVGFNESTEMPYSGYGFLLDAGESWSFDIDEIGKTRVFATTSGDLVSYGGVTR